jgi:GPH family glycoside/pentoside/hexuronide:cation symporter
VSARAAPLSRNELVAYALPAAGITAMFFLVSLYQLKFATDVLRLSPGAIGLVFGCARLWDAVSDPLAGWSSDRTRTRLGRRRPWLLLAALPTGTAFAAMWSPPASAGPFGLFVWTCASVLLFYTALAALQIPHIALGAELTPSHHGRTRVFAAKAAFDAFGMFLAVAALHHMETATSPRAAARDVGLGLGVLAAALAIYAGLRVRERVAVSSATRRAPWRDFADVWRNPHARRLLGVFFLAELGTGALATALPYASGYILETPGATATYLLCYLVPVLLFIPVWLPVSRRLGKARTWCISNALCALGFAAFYGLGKGDAFTIAALSAGIGAANAAGRVMPPSIQADVIDYDELHTGQRREGVYFAAWNLVGKAAGGLSVALVAGLLALFGFAPGAPVGAEAVLGIRFAVSVAPAGLYAISVVLLARFALDEDAHRTIRTALDARGVRGVASPEEAALNERLAQRGVHLALP